MTLYYKKISVVAFAIMLCLLTQVDVYAQKQPVSMATPLVGDSVKTGKTLALQDTVYYNGSLNPYIAQTNGIDNIVSLQADEFLDNKLPPDTFHVVVRINVTYTTTNNTNSSRLDTLTIFYSKNYPYNNKAVKLYRNFRSVNVEILDVAITGATATLVRPLLRMDNMMVIDRNFTTSCNAVTGVDTLHSTGDELTVKWFPVDFISAYDLEWTFIDKAALDSGNYNNTGGQLDPLLIFKNNSTRVTLKNVEYGIPLLYDGAGTVFFRVRTLQNAPDGEVIAGLWSSDAGLSGLGKYNIIHDTLGHESKLNWQATTTYAEEGKRKSVVQYYDGSLKGRQTVTKDNTTQTTVVAETFYDKQGRPVIQVLPSPTLSKLIAYTPLFNQKGDVTPEEYDKSQYDTLIDADDYCATGAPPMGTANGSSQYYSPSNPLLSAPQPDYHKFVPDAAKYPFTETRYTRDNTGRIDRQGGVGVPFQIGSGHETKYYYGSADQKELDALFGTDAGDASHYEKNMVRDANGQYSVSYVDMHGRTVATALAGDSGINLDRLPSYNSVMQTDNLLTPVNNIIKDNNIQSAKSILVPANGDYIFSYSLSPESLSLNDCKDSTICYDCLYDLTITISDNCSNVQFGGNPIVIKKSNFSLFKEDSVTHNLDTTCLVANTITILDTFPLQEGSYDITKTLSISKAGMQYYRDSVFLPHNTCKSFNQLVIELLDSIRQDLDCTPDSATTILTTAYKEQMMADLRPLSGQYADTATLRSCFSIFSPHSSGKLQYQSDEAGTYYDENGNPDPLPKTLSPEEFIANFKDSWLEALLPLHPEYRLWLEYEKLKSAYSWEADFFNTETYAEAVVKGFLNPTGSTNAPANQFTVSGKIDSLFIALGISDPGVVNNAKNDINAALFQYLKKGEEPYYYTLWGLSTGIVKCTDKNNETCFDHWNENTNVFNTDSLCKGDLDMAWRMFRSQYLLIREDWVDNYARQKSGVPNMIGSPCHAVFPNRDISLITGQQYGGYNETAEDTTTAKNNLNEFLLDNCTAFATQWWQQLAPCGYTPADSLVIIPKLIQVAYEGADAQHPFGASTVKPSSTHTDRSFEEVITEYNAIHYPSIDPLTCNAYLITNPKPYDQPGMIVNLPIIAAPDSCACNRITELYYKFIIDSATYHSFSNYMLQTQGTSISQGTLDTLRNLCNNANATCKYLEKPILLPPALQCGMSDVCVSCTEVKALKDSFAVKFPGIIPTQEESDTIQQKKNELFANFMNHHLGFSMQAYEYLQFLNTCPDTIAVSCDSTYWTVYNPGTNLQINTDLYINSFNNIPPVSQFFSNGYFNAPSLAQAGHYVLVNKRDSLQVDTATLLMQWRVKPAAVPDMVNPFIRRGSITTYVGAEWIQDPTDTSWWIGATLLKEADGTRIGGMGLQSNSHVLQADWVKITNTGTGAVLYFNNFSAAENCPGYAMGPFLCGKQAMDSSIILNMNPCADTMHSAIQGATYLFDIYRQKIKGQFEKAYMKKCLDAGKLESFTVTHPLTEYHYTLYYYDQAGNLVKTVPPEGVHHARRQSWFDSVGTARNAGEHLPAPHTLATTYRYNSLNQVISQHSPDGGLSRFWYDRLGRLVVSQNGKQLADSSYSYTLYDDLGRITEVGQKKQITAMSDAIARQQSSLKTWLGYTYTLEGINIVAEQVTSTVYDIKDPQSGTLPASGYVVNPGFQKAYTLRNRVSFTRFYEKLKWNGSSIIYYPDYDNSTTYSYDIHGNVDTLLHNYRTGMMAATAHSVHYNQYKTMSYRYDLVSGKVNEVHYQPGMADQLYHRYEYDAENRLTNAYTTDQKALMGIQGLEEHEAFYQYYKHGPLARTVLGQLQVQGVDYAYTLQGWLKGVNSDSLLDGDGLSPTGVAKDAYRFSLNYFNGDYAAISASLAGVFPGHSSQLPSASDYRPLFNGNISSMVVGVPKLGGMRLYNYGYDQLNRIVKMDSYTGYDGAEMEWGTLNAHGGEYKERIAYDANGNILKYLRNGHAGQLNMDSLNYGYNRDGNGYLTNNKLRHVKDNVADGNYTEAIDNIEDIDNQGDDNYEYDAIGNLIKDTKEGIDNIEWTVYGKIKKITKSNGTEISYTYDVAGNRISKAVKISGVTTTTWYARDAQGNVMAVYSGNNTDLALNEQHIYGSSRLGIWNRNVDMDIAPNAISYIFTRGNKFFELSNHLGNVLATVSDKKIGVDPGADGTIDYFNADVVSANDYYPFGMQMPGRKYAATGSYRYGFNGKENDNDAGEGIQDYGMRIYSERLGRFLSVDPITKKYPELTPYQFASNRPIDGVDMDGLEYVKRIHTVNAQNQIISTKDIVYYTMTEQQIKALGGTPAGRNNSAAYGPEGKGIKHEYKFENGKPASDPVWNLKGSYATHGLYSGDGSITYTGRPDANGKKGYDYSWAPIDAADAIAKRHDEHYTNVGAYDVVEDSRTLFADLQMVDEATQYLKSVPFKLVTSQRVAGETIVAATSQKALMTVFADYKAWKQGYMISRGMDPKSEADNKIVSLDRWYYRLKYINSVKGEKTKRAVYLAILLGAKSKTGDDKKKE